MAVKLKCVSNYRNDAAGYFFKAGQIFTVEPDIAHFLQVDSPGSFIPVEPEPTIKSKPVAEPKSTEPKKPARKRTTRRKSTPKKTG